MQAKRAHKPRAMVSYADMTITDLDGNPRHHVKVVNTVLIFPDGGESITDHLAGDPLVGTDPRRRVAPLHPEVRKWLAQRMDEMIALAEEQLEAAHRLDHHPGQYWEVEDVERAS